MKNKSLLFLISLMMILAISPAWSGEIHDCAAKGNLNRVKEIIERNPELMNSQDVNGETPLYWAVYNENDALLQLLISNKANVNIPKNTGVTPLHIAAERGHLATVKLLLNNGADPNLIDNFDRTPLTAAENAKRQAVIDFLKPLTKPSVVIQPTNPQDSYVTETDNPLIVLTSPPEGIWAIAEFRFVSIKEPTSPRALTTLASRGGARANSISTFELNAQEVISGDVRLASVGAQCPTAVIDPKLAQSVTNGIYQVYSAGGVPLITINRDLPILPPEVKEPLLLAIDPKTPSTEASWDILLAKKLPVRGIIVERLPQPSKTGFIYQLKYGMIGVKIRNASPGEFVTSLAGGDYYTTNGIELDYVDRKNNQLTLSIKTEDNVSYTVQFIMNGGEIISEIKMTRKDNKTVSEVIKSNPDYPVAVSSSVFQQQAPLGSPGNYVRAKIISDNGKTAYTQAVYQQSDSRSRTDLHFFAEVGDDASITELIKNGAQVDSIDFLGRTPLHWAAMTGRGATVTLLMTNKADPEIKDKQGQTPLHLAAATGQTNVIKLFIEKGIKIDIQDTMGLTPLKLAETNQHKACVNLLRDYTKLYIERQIANGSVERVRKESSPPGAVRYWDSVAYGHTVRVIDIDMNNPFVRVEVALPRWGLGSNESFRGFVNRLDPTAAINGTYFDVSSNLPVGDIVINGELKYFGGLGTGLCITKDNKVHIRRAIRGSHTDWSMYKTVVCAGPRLLYKGQVMISAREEGFRDPSVLGSASRIAAGVTADNHLLWVKVSGSCTLNTLAEVMKEVGCTDALNFDGGSSIGMFYRGNYVAYPGRSLTNVLVVYDN